MSTRLLARHSTTTSVSPSLAPSYTTQDLNAAAIELTSWNDASSSRRASILSSPPLYSSAHTFHPTIHLQIQTPGKPWLSLPIPPKPVPIPIFDVNPDDNSLPPEPRYVSVRPGRGSGSSYLIPGSSPSSAKPLSTTTYRFGPGKPPAVSLFLPSQSRDAEGGEEEAWDSFSILSTSLLSRAQRLHHTRLGTFEWRYASRSERKAMKANSVLVLEKIVKVAIAGGKEEEVRRAVALFVRSEETRTPGSSASSAGNGGRLMVDLGAWEEGEKVEREMVVVLVVTTAIAMLKKEVDRRRAQQIAIMASGAGGS
ncbi:hypothetical protein CONLIGDRAFT_426271 [Coniochaeta ligniaria NRRL 30616]|uniref:Uncharacterized protein n=1 Tax=Coniochaeta ligniaria NRRL 30616 TaxID=1408157 RepID=A0A1J7IJA6_9PEZI|nr:hypothetical protein CONLIGDRAFT_426271 [Coniochaeta ligniaria NRRL 30616]